MNYQIEEEQLGELFQKLLKQRFLLLSDFQDNENDKNINLDINAMKSFIEQYCSNKNNNCDLIDEEENEQNLLKNKFHTISNIPEILQIIFYFCDENTLLNISKCSKFFFSIYKNIQLQKIYLLLYGTPQQLNLNHGILFHNYNFKDNNNKNDVKYLFPNYSSIVDEKIVNNFVNNDTTIEKRNEVMKLLDKEYNEMTNVNHFSAMEDLDTKDTWFTNDITNSLLFTYNKDKIEFFLGHYCDYDLADWHTDGDGYYGELDNDWLEHTDTKDNEWDEDEKNEWAEDEKDEWENEDWHIDNDAGKMETTDVDDNIDDYYQEAKSKKRMDIIEQLDEKLQTDWFDDPLIDNDGLLIQNNNIEENKEDEDEIMKEATTTVNEEEKIFTSSIHSLREYLNFKQKQNNCVNKQQTQTSNGQ
ncbi:hypothetical protein ABK040_009171 [Willaertia magna]